MTRNSSGLFPLLIAVALSIVAAPSWAQKKPSERGAPPPPMEVTIKVKREVRTEIPLQIYGRRNELLKFIIRTPPEHGQVTEPQQTGKETAAVIYDPPADLSVTRDKFFFAVQSSEGVSAPVQVSITILDASPVLAIPAPMDFPKILAGTTSTKIFQLSNRGGGLAAGEIMVDAPWHLAGPSTYRIGAGEVAAFKLVFEPKAGGTFDGAIRFTSDLEHSTLINGDAFDPLSVAPAKITMVNSPGDSVRTGSFEILNQTNQDRSVQMHGGPRILMPDRISVPAQGKVTVPIQTAGTDIEAIDGEIRMESAGFSLAVPVKSPAVSPIFKASGNRVSLGRQPADKPGTGSVEIENVGGSMGSVTLTAASPFLVEPAKAIISPGEKKSFQITLAPSAPGEYRTWLQLKGGGQELELGLEAQLYAGATRTAAGAEGGASAPPPAVDETLRAEPVSPEPEAAKVLTPTVPNNWGVASAYVAGVKLLEISPNSATLAWPENLSPATRYRFEFRHIGLDASRAMMVSWIEHQPVTVQHKDGRYIATMGDLRSGEMQAVQVLPLNEAGEPGKRIFALDFSTPRVDSTTTHVSPLQWLSLALVACLGVWVWRTVRRTPTNFI